MTTNRLSLFKLFFFTCLFIHVLSLANTKDPIKDSLEIYNKRVKQIALDKSSNRDKNYKELKEAYSFYKKHDSHELIMCLVILSDVARLKRLYAKSFDHLWEALYLAEHYDRDEILVNINRKFAALYDIYNMSSKALTHLETSLKYSKKTDSTKNRYQTQLNVCYFRLGVKERELGNYKRALSFLDSCKISTKLENSNTWFIPALENEKAKSYIELGQLHKAQLSIDKALSRPLGAQPLAKKSVSYFRSGELNEKKGQIDSAIYYFKRCILLLKTSNIGLSYVKEANYKLSKLYAQKKKYQDAYKFLARYEKLLDSLSHAKDIGNDQIFEARNSYQQKLLNNEIVIENQKEELNRKAITQSRLRITIILLLILFSISSFTYWIWLRQKRLIASKENARLAAELDKEKIESHLKLQSQELTSNVLQLIDKEATVKELLETIKEISPKKYQEFNNKHLVGSKQLWDEFNTRFTSVNSEFYKKLNKICPELSRTEQKHCALIKLNFSTKEMAQILNVEAQTVNMSRSRIRKKLGMQRSESLSSFISSL